MQVFKMSDALLSKTQTCIIDMNSRKTFKGVVIIVNFWPENLWVLVISYKSSS